MTLYIEDGFEDDTVGQNPSKWTVVAGDCKVVDTPIYQGTKACKIDGNLARMHKTLASAHTSGKHTFRAACCIPDSIADAESEIQLNNSIPAILGEYEFYKDGNDLKLRIYQAEEADAEVKIAALNQWFLISIIYDLDKAYNANDFQSIYINAKKIGEYEAAANTTVEVESTWFRGTGENSLAYYDFIKWESGEVLLTLGGDPFFIDFFGWVPNWQWLQQWLQQFKIPIPEAPPVKKIDWKKVAAGIGIGGAGLVAAAIALSQLEKEEKEKEKKKVKEEENATNT